MLEDARLVKNIRIIVGLGVAARQAQGKGAATIRDEVLAVAKEEMREHLADELEYESAVMVAQREVDRLLGGGEPLASVRCLN